MKDHKLIGALALILFVTCLVGIAKAGTLNATVVHATQYEDGTPMPVTDITQTRVEYGSCVGAAFGTKAGEFVITGSGTTGSKTGLAPGTYCQRAYTTAKGKESVASNVTTATIDQPSPKPPVLSAVALALNIPLDSKDGFQRTAAFSITSNGPGVLLGMAKLGTPSVQDNLFTYRGQMFCKPLLNHPVTGAPNIAWIKGISPTTEVAVPCGA